MTKYKGWTNYETWAAHLWMMNDQASQDHWTDAVEEIREEPNTSDVLTDEQNVQFILAARMKEEITDGSPLNSAPSMYSDLLGAALSDVKWDEIALWFME